jgi:hypothetical protein
MVYLQLADGGFFGMERNGEERTTQNAEEDPEVGFLVEDEGEVGLDPVPPCEASTFLWAVCAVVFLVDGLLWKWRQPTHLISFWEIQKREETEREREIYEAAEQRTKMSGRLLKESALCCNALYAHAAWARGACNPFDFMNKMNHKQPTKKKRWITNKEQLVFGKLHLTAGLDFRVS